MRILIDQKEFTIDELKAWKKKRRKKVLHNLKSDITGDENTDEKCLELKLKYSYEDMIKLLHKKLFIGTVGMKIASFISFGKRRNAITVIYVDGIDAKTMNEKVDELMLKNREEYKRANLNVCPDHYVLNPHNGILEVIETTGCAPVPTQFFITFNDERGIKEPRDLNYEYQSTGVAKLKDGTIIGGVRHQFKNTDKGVKARLLVEFPIICPKILIREHQKHLAAEWSGWISWILKEEQVKSQLEHSERKEGKE